MTSYDGEGEIGRFIGVGVGLMGSGVEVEVGIGVGIVIGVGVAVGVGVGVWVFVEFVSIFGWFCTGAVGTVETVGLVWLPPCG